MDRRGSGTIGHAAAVGSAVGSEYRESAMRPRTRLAIAGNSTKPPA